MAPQPAFGGAPDYAEPFVGWRLWLVVADGGYLWLESVLYSVRWMPLRAFEATCVPHRRCELCSPAARAVEPAHVAPDESCHCGVYAVADASSLASYLDSAYPGKQAVDRVIGQVRLWGKVIECERGWRASHAYPDCLFVRAGSRASTVAAGLADYAAPIEIIPSESTPDFLWARPRAA